MKSRCGICFSPDHETKKHPKHLDTFEPIPTYRCPSCAHTVTDKQLKAHKKFGCSRFNAPIIPEGERDDHSGQPDRVDS